MDHEAHETRFDRELGRLGIRIRDADQTKVRENVFDEVTLLALYRLAHKKWITAVGGAISTGKEANVFAGKREDEDVAIKIYRIRTANFNAMSSYIIGDRRFSQIGHSKKDIVFTWTQKEFSNLMRASDAGLPVPRPLVWDRNILIMEFLGSGGIAYPHLRNAVIADPSAAYGEIVSCIGRLYTGAGLVHADLSEFNILWDGDHPHIIDMGQSVLTDHPNALRFLIRDISNVNRYFSRLCEVRDERKIFTEVTGMYLQKESTSDTDVPGGNSDATGN